MLTSSGFCCHCLSLAASLNLGVYVQIPLLRSLNSKLLIIVICFVVGSGVFSAYYQADVEERAQLEKMDAALLYFTEHYGDELSEDLFERHYILSAARYILIKDLEKRATLTSWNVQTEGNWRVFVPMIATMFETFYIIAADGSNLAHPGVMDVEMSEITQTFPEFMADKRLMFAWTPAYFDPQLKQRMISLVLPVYIHGEFFGVISGGLSLDYLLDKLPQADSLGRGARAIIFHESGRFILQRNQGQGVSDAIDTELSLFVADVVANRIDEGELFDFELSGQREHGAFQRLQIDGWGVAAFYPVASIRTVVAPIANRIYLGTFVLVLLLTCVLYFSLRNMVIRRIERLADATSSVGQENFSIGVPETGSDEIGVLGRCINEMLAKINGLVSGLNENIANLEKANLESRKLTGAIEHSSNAVAIINARGEHEYGNRRFWILSGYHRDKEELGLKALMLPPSMDLGRVWQEINDTLATEDEWRFEYEAVGNEGKTFWYMQSISTIRSNSGDIQYYICAGRDISQSRRQQKEVERLAYYDQLTGLQNRVLFKTQLQTAIKSCERDGNQIALLYLDLDHFKRVNDTLGHEAGDNLLVEVAKRLKGCLRDEDSVARLGGDEFAVLLNRIGSPQFASLVASKIIKALSKPFVLSGQEVSARASVGITLAPIDSNNIDVLMKNADLAMYQAKEKGRNSFQFYTTEMNLEVASRLQLEREMQNAIKNNEFVLYYQPQVDLATGKITGAEALIRWQHPTRGLVSPLEFIPLAEETGMIVPIGKWALRSACQQAKSIQKGLNDPIKISVNISSRQLKEDTFTDELRGVFNEVRIDPSLIELEVTESVLMDNIESVSKVLRGVRELGVDIAIDDFGTGYSSLSYLKKLPVSTLKVDREFVKDLPEDMEDRAITGLIVTMAGALNHKVVVEGVETVEQLSFLHDIGCDYAQGFYYSRPITADALMVLLFDWSAKNALDWGRI